MEDKNVAKRPEANKGGREEENRSGITSKAKRPRRLRNNETEISRNLMMNGCMTPEIGREFLGVEVPVA